MIVSILLLLYAGFLHAFETDHVLAVSNMVIARGKFSMAIKDGAFWGFGHTSTILLMGVLVLLFKLQADPSLFSWFEAAVGLMLIVLGLYRLLGSKNSRSHEHVHPTRQWPIDKAALQLSGTASNSVKYSVLPAYMVGLVHGLAGSGTLLVLMMTQVKTASAGLLYLLLFGLGSVAGMVLVASICMNPVSKRFLKTNAVRSTLSLISAGLCIGYGGWIIYKNIIAV